MVVFEVKKSTSNLLKKVGSLGIIFLIFANTAIPVFAESVNTSNVIYPPETIVPYHFENIQITSFASSDPGIGWSLPEKSLKSDLSSVASGSEFSEENSSVLNRTSYNTKIENEVSTTQEIHTSKI